MKETRGNKGSKRGRFDGDENENDDDGETVDKLVQKKMKSKKGGRSSRK